MANGIQQNFLPHDTFSLESVLSDSILLESFLPGANWTDWAETVVIVQFRQNFEK